MRFLQHHWFNIVVVLLVFLALGMTLLIAFSPKQDAKKRGFIPCTLQLAEQVANCRGGLWCTTKAVVKNSWCDSKVIGQGIKLWLQKQQPAPWSNYFFTPDLSHLETSINEHAELFYQENPNYIQDFENLKREHKKLEESIEHDKEEH
ncbi:MAG: hypothetical protein IJ660_01435 [Alphaproteobacteria bacterium]|nr:hypothetical protein [Alphaproteobacteria bacterium]